ncbi:hypothetical protein HOLleu_06067 [Holothuria leucospilota]|uniref:Uncharacterized protein n=1 Tax=Holothuria leucospilota TaxID=206669 RepID=A0A9Q1CLK0_HOLLE|nr:hypothetical protein HOLleu_06067 [Holothuria leucospilota]
MFDLQILILNWCVFSFILYLFFLSESNSSPSVEDDCDFADFAKLTPKQRRMLRAERCKPVTTSGASHKGESKEGTPEERSTGLAAVTTGASSSSDPVEEKSQAGPAQATTKHPGASQTKDQLKTELIQKEQDLENEQKNVPSTSSKIQPKNTSTHKEKGLTSEGKEGGNREESKEGNREESKVQISNGSKNTNTTTPKKEQNKNQSTSQVQEPSCDVAVNESRGKGKDPKKHTCDNAKKQPKEQPVIHDQSPTCEAYASKQGGKLMEPKKPSSDNAMANVPMTSNKDQTKKQSSQIDQGPTRGAVVGKKGSKGKDEKKHLSDSATENVPATSFKEQPMRQASLQHRPTYEAEICKKGCKVMEPKQPSCDNAKNNVPTTSSKEQPKKQLTHKDQGLASEAENAKTGCKEKEPKKHTCANAKKSAPGTSSKEHHQSNSTPQKEQKTHICDDAKKNVSITSGKEQPKKQLPQKDQGHTLDAAAAKKGCNGKEAKKSSSGSARKLDPNATGKEHTENRPTQEDKGPACTAQTGAVRCKWEDTRKPGTCENPEKCVATTSMKKQPKKKQDHCETFAAKNKGKGKMPKKHNVDSIKDIDGPTTSHSKKLKQEPTQKGKGPTCETDAGKKKGKAQGVKSDTEKELTASVTSNQCIAKKVETPSCLPGNSKEVAEHCANSIKASESEWTLVGKNTTNNKKRKVGSSEKYEAGPKKPPTSQTRIVKEKPSKTSAEPSQPKLGDKHQKPDEPPKKKRPTRRAKKKPKGKRTPSDAVTAKKEASPTSIQEQCPTNTKEAHRAVANTWANIVKSKPNFNTPPLQSDSKAPEIQDEQTQKETTLEKCEAETTWNVPVTYKKCIGRKMKTLCVEQDGITASSITAKTLRDSSTDDKQEVKGSSQTPVNETSTNSLITQGKQLKDPSNGVIPKQEWKWPLPPPVNQPTDFPITQGAGRKDSVRPGTEKPSPALHVKQDYEFNLMDSFIPNFPVKLVDERDEEVEETSAEHHNADSPITQEAGMTDCIKPETGRSNSTSLVKQEEILHLMDLVIPNYPVKLVEEREEEVEETSAEHHNDDLPIAQEAGMKDSVGSGGEKPQTVQQGEELHMFDSFIPNYPVKLVEEREEEVEETSAEHHNANSPITQEAGVTDSVRPGTEKSISAPLVKQEEVLHLMDLVIPNFPVKLVEEREEKVQETSAEHHSADLPIAQEAGMKDSCGSGQEKPKNVQQGEELHMFDSFIPNYPVELEEEREEKKKASTEHHNAILPMSQHESCTIIPTETNILMQDKPKDGAKSVSVLITTATQTGEPTTLSRILPAVLEPLDQIRLTDQATCRELLTSTSTQTDEHVPQTVKSLNTAVSVQQEPTDHRLTAKSEGLKSVPETSTQDAPNMGFSQMSALSPAFVPSSTSSAVNPHTTLVKYVQDPTTQAVNSLMSARPGQSDRMLTVNSEVQRSLPVRYAQGMPTTNISQMSAFSPAYSPHAFSPLVQQHGNTFPAVNPPTMVAYIEDPSTLQYGTTYYQNYNYPAPTTGTWHTGYESTLYNAYSTYAPVHQRAVLSPMVEPYMKTTFPVVPLGVAPTTKAALPSFTCITKATALKLRKQQSYITPAVKQVVQKPDQVTSSKAVPTINKRLKTASQAATETPKTAAPLEQQRTNTTPAVKQVVQKPHQTTSSESAPTINAPLETASPAATKTPKAAAPLKQQLTNTTPAVKQVMQKPHQATSSEAAPTINAPLETAAPAATKTPKAAAPLKQQLANTTPAVKQVVQKPHQATSSEAATNINAPLETASPAATKTSKAAAPLKQQVTSSKAATTDAPMEEPSPPATKTPKAAAPLKQQQNNTTPALKQVVLKPDQVTSSKVMLTTRAPPEEASPSATKISKAAAPRKEHQTNGTPAVKQVGQKSHQVKFSKDMSTSSAHLEEASSSANKTPRAASMLNHLQTTNTPVHEQEVHEPGQNIYPMVLNATNTSQEQRTSETSNEQTAVATMVKQSDITCHSLSEVTFSQSVRPKERDPVATPSSSKNVKTSDTNQINFTATGPKNGRSARRRRARGRQRERKRAEAEKRAAEAEKKAATETSEGAVAEQTEEADSSNHHGEVASSSSSEIILNFDDDSEFVIDWEAEAAKPFYNSTEIFPPRVEIPEWAQWDFTQNERLQQLGRENLKK